MKRFTNHLWRATLTVGLIVTAVIATSYLTSTHTSAHAPKTARSALANPTANSAAKTDLTNRVGDIIGGYPDVQTGVSLIDLASNTQLDFGETAAFTAASTTKIITAAAYMHQVEQGDATLDATISGSTANDLLQRMLNLSDNDAWAALNDYLGKSELQTYASSIGLTSYDAADNIITAHDEALLLSKLTTHQLTSGSHATLLLSYMQHTNNDDLIPAALPSQATVYHKYGYLNGELHDAAVVTDQGHHFVVVIFTKNNDGSLDDYAARTQLFHDLTTAVVGYESSL